MDTAPLREHFREVDPLLRQCPQCQAQVQLPPGQRRAACPRCGHDIELLVVAASNRLPATPRSFDRDDSPLAPVALAVLGMVVLAIIAAVALIFINRGIMLAEAAHRRELQGQTHTAPLIAGPAPIVRETIWYEPEAPSPAHIGPSEGFVGLFVREQGRVGQVYVGAFDGASLRPLWTAGPLGETAEATLYLHSAVGPSRVVVTDNRRAARVYALASGEPELAIPLPDRALRVCAGPQDQFFIELANRQGRLLEARTGRSLPAARPSWCPAPPGPDAPPECAALLQRVQLRASCAAADSVPRLEGFHAEWVLREGELEVAVGTDEKDHLPAAAAFRRGARTPLWRKVLPGSEAGEVAPRFPLLSDLVAGVLYAKVEHVALPYHPHLVALDARTGALRWETELFREEHTPPPAMAISQNHVYVATEGQLQVLDQRTGKAVGTIGD